MTKVAGEDLCELVAAASGLACTVLRTSRFFPEGDDSEEVSAEYDDANAKVNELLYRRVDIADVVDAHVAAMGVSPTSGFAKYVLSATTPFQMNDVTELRANAPAVVKRLFPTYEEIYGSLGWRMFSRIDRVYVNTRARAGLDWAPRFGFQQALQCLSAGVEWRSPLAVAIGAKGYHPDTEGPYTVR